MQRLRPNAKRRPNDPRTRWTWRVTGRRAAWILNAVGPFLKLKSFHAALGVVFDKKIETHLPHKGARVGVNEEADRQNMWDLLHRVNRPKDVMANADYH